MANLNLGAFEQNDRLSKLFSGESLTTPEGEFNFESLIASSKSAFQVMEQAVFETPATVSNPVETVMNEVTTFKENLNSFETLYEAPFVEFNNQYFDANLSLVKDMSFEAAIYEMPQFQDISPIAWDMAVLTDTTKDLSLVYGFNQAANMLFEEIIPQTSEPFEQPLHHLMTAY
jgi:hypothetical protein